MAESPIPNVRIDQIVLAHENERQHIVYEIHDGVIQYLVAAMMHLEAARIPGRVVNPKVSSELDNVERFLTQGLDEARALMNSIVPPILGEQGIVAALEHLVADNVVNHTAKIKFSHHVADLEISPIIEATLFRVAQQSLANIRQHSNTQVVEIDLTTTTGEVVELSIRDFGEGFDPDEVTEGLGLRSMRTRVEALAGGLSITRSNPGTLVTATLPVVDQLSYESNRRAQAEAESRQAAERLSLALRATTDAIWDCDLLSGEVHWNEGYDQLFGERPPATKHSWKWWIDHIHMKDRERVVTSLTSAAKSGQNTAIAGLSPTCTSDATDRSLRSEIKPLFPVTIKECRPVSLGACEK